VDSGPTLDLRDRNDWTVTSTSFAITNAARRVAQKNASRVVLVLAGSSAIVWVATRAGVTVGNGLPIATTTTPLVLTWQDHGPLVTSDWFAITAAPINMEIIEVAYNPVRVADNIFGDDDGSENRAEPAEYRDSDYRNANRWQQSAPVGADYFGRVDESLFARLWDGRNP
jgi:hypothetical protein